MSPTSTVAVFIILFLFEIQLNNVTADVNPKEKNIALNFTKSAAQYGYLSEEHTVTTEDGYILTIFRIPRGKNCKGRVRNPPVLLMHGLYMNSDVWLDAGPSASLVFLLSDACHDLWVGNVRGNFYGRRHLRLNPYRDPLFWKFYSDEMGRYDLTATIDYILDKTGVVKLNYIGYSQGGRMGFIMCSETLGYCEKIGVFISLAPSVRLKYTRSFPVKLMSVYSILEPFLTKPKLLEVGQRSGFIARHIAFFCKNYLLARVVCRHLLNMIDSNDPGSIDATTIQILFNHYPDGTSARNLASYGQNLISGKFQKYSYGPIMNAQIYGNIKPPLYNLNRTTIPVVVLYGMNDFLVDAKDTRWLINQLPNVVEGSPVKSRRWNHFDNVYSKNMRSQIFDRIKPHLDKYSDND